MTTLVDALAAIVIANWGAGGGGGVVPATIVAITDYRTLVPARDSVDNIYLELGDVNRRQINNNYADVISNITVTVTTATGDDRLKVIVDEARWICNNVAVTGVSNQKVIRERDKSDRVRKVWIYEFTVECIENLVSSSSAYASGTATTFMADHLIGSVDVTTAALTVTGAATVGSVVTAGTVDGVDVSTLSTLAGATVTAAQLEDLLMYGNANAAWVNCPFVLETTVGKVYLEAATTSITNTDDTDVNLRFDLTEPLLKGTLKLYVSNLQLVLADADADDYVTAAGIFGYSTALGQVLIGPTDWTTDRTAAGTYTYTMAAAVDVSAYTAVYVRVNCVATNAADLDIQSVSMLVYYGT